MDLSSFVDYCRTPPDSTGQDQAEQGNPAEAPQGVLSGFFLLDNAQPYPNPERGLQGVLQGQQKNK